MLHSIPALTKLLICCNSVLLSERQVDSRNLIHEGPSLIKVRESFASPLSSLLKDDRPECSDC